MNKTERAAIFCQEVLAEMDRTQDLEEKLILLGVLTNQLNEWSLAMRLEAMRKNREPINLNP